MARPAQPRSVTHEANLARRIAYEREKRGWTYETLGRRMARAGCPVATSALHKIEKGAPARRINVDEFLTFARVFETEPMELLRHPDEVERQVLAAAMQQARRAQEKAAPHLRDLLQGLQAVSGDLTRHPESRGAVSAPLDDLFSSVTSLYSQLRDFVEPDERSDESNVFVIRPEGRSHGEHPEAP